MPKYTWHDVFVSVVPTIVPLVNAREGDVYLYFKIMLGLDIKIMFCDKCLIVPIWRDTDLIFSHHKVEYNVYKMCWSVCWWSCLKMWSLAWEPMCLLPTSDPSSSRWEWEGQGSIITRASTLLCTQLIAAYLVAVFFFGEDELSGYSGRISGFCRGMKRPSAVEL